MNENPAQKYGAGFFILWLLNLFKKNTFLYLPQWKQQTKTGGGTTYVECRELVPIVIIFEAFHHDKPFLLEQFNLIPTD